MESKRLKRVESLLREEMSKVIYEIKNSIFEHNAIMTITEVKVSPDLSSAKYFISIFNQSSDINILDYLNEHSTYIRGLLGKLIKGNLRVIPEVEFLLDKTAAHAQRIDELLKSAKEQDQRIKGE